MQKPERFVRAIESLRKAFFKGTLRNQHCQACAVGTIVAAAYGKEVTKEIAFGYSEESVVQVGEDLNNTEWDALFMNGRKQYNEENLNSIFYLTHARLIKKARALIKPTGYSELELALIERAFETNRTKLKQNLLRAIEAICIIDNQDFEETKKLFEACPNSKNPIYPLIPNE